MLAEPKSIYGGESVVSEPTRTMTIEERLLLANRLFREFRALCFWHSPPDRRSPKELIPFVVKGLRGHGGHRGFRLAAELERGVVPELNRDEPAPES